MISIDFFAAQGALTGFSAHGHADTAPYGEDIVCAAVSSACLLTANTITEVLHLPAAVPAKYSSFDFGGVSHAQVRYSAFCT